MLRLSLFAFLSVPAVAMAQTQQDVANARDLLVGQIAHAAMQLEGYANAADHQREDAQARDAADLAKANAQVADLQKQLKAAQDEIAKLQTPTPATSK